MNTELVRVQTADQVVLHGAYYRGGSHSPAVLVMHGAAMNFYTGVGRFCRRCWLSRAIRW